MPIIDLGYRAWTGERTSRWVRPLAITQTGLQLVWRTVWLRRLLMFAWLPILPVGVGFFIFEQSLNSEAQQVFLIDVMEDAFQRPDIAEILRQDPTQARHQIWGQMLYSYFRYPQSINMVLLFGLVAPRIISFDIRSRAHLLYFSRPLTVVEYLIGKALILISLLTLTTVIPALTCYLLGVLLSPDLAAFYQTWDFPFRIGLAAILFALPTASLAILLSSFTHDSRYASFAWFAIWVLGWVTYGVLTSTELINNQGASVFASSTNIRLLSLYHALGDVQAAAFGILADPSEANSAMMLVGVITIVSIVVTYYRVAGQLRLS
ncbi:MAG: hypothetical protein KDE20_23270 [Caldilineaceae bacterium]|nr:hypothetical protein [Caldilineaceae bacterium]